MINIDITFVFQIVNVLILMVVLNFCLYRPIRKILAERDVQISGAREKTALVDREVQEKLAQYEARLKEVKSQASNERGGLIKEAQVEEAAIIEKARKEATASLSAIKNKVAKEAADAGQLLREQALSLSSEICEKVLGRSL